MVGEGTEMQGPQVGIRTHDSCVEHQGLFIWATCSASVLQLHHCVTCLIIPLSQFWCCLHSSGLYVWHQVLRSFPVLNYMYCSFCCSYDPNWTERLCANEKKKTVGTDRNVGWCTKQQQNDACDCSSSWPQALLLIMKIIDIHISKILRRYF